MTSSYDNDLDMAMSPPSDDGDALVADLLEQFAAPSAAGGADNKKRPQEPLLVGTPSPETSCGEEKRWQKLSGIEVPRIDNPDDHEYLPGHFTVRRVISEEHTSEGSRYRVKLESGEKEWVS